MVRVEATALSPVKNNNRYNSLEWHYVTGAMSRLDGDDDDSLEMGRKLFKI